MKFVYFIISAFLATAVLSYTVARPATDIILLPGEAAIECDQGCQEALLKYAVKFGCLEPAFRKVVFHLDSLTCARSSLLDVRGFLDAAKELGTLVHDNGVAELREKFANGDTGPAEDDEAIGRR